MERIRYGLELFNRGDYAASIAELAEEIEWDTSAAVPDGDLYRGREAVLGLWRGLADRWDDFRIVPERWIEGDGVVLMLGTLIARGTESGVPVEGTWDQVWHLAGDEPVRCENHSDRAAAWRSSGLPLERE